MNWTPGPAPTPDPSIRSYQQSLPTPGLGAVPLSVFPGRMRSKCSRSPPWAWSQDFSTVSTATVLLSTRCRSISVPSISDTVRDGDNTDQSE